MLCSPLLLPLTYLSRVGQEHSTPAAKGSPQCVQTSGICTWIAPCMHMKSVVDASFSVPTLPSASAAFMCLKGEPSDASKQAAHKALQPGALNEVTGMRIRCETRKSEQL